MTKETGRFPAAACTRVCRGAVLLAALVPVLTLAVCESLRSALKEPALSLDSVEMTGIDFDGVDLLCKINVDNPNAFDIPFPEMVKDLTRIAMLNAPMWTELFIENGTALVGRIRQFERSLERIGDLIAKGDAPARG